MATSSLTIPHADSATTAFFHDIWAGPVPAFVAPFRTKRNGESVMRYRWQRTDGQHCCSAVFVTPEQAIAASPSPPEPWAAAGRSPVQISARRLPRFPERRRSFVRKDLRDDLHTSYLNRWTRPACYVGAEWPDYFSSGVGQSRDSDALERSNFACMLKALGGESETVLVIRESHWAVGWVEWIAIHESDEKALAVADGIKRDLADYPVISDDHFTETEMEEANDVWRDCFNDQERVDYMRKHRDQFEFHGFADLIGCARGRYFAGYASELLN